jgi:hypothetical protein
MFPESFLFLYWNLEFHWNLVLGAWNLPFRWCLPSSYCLRQLAATSVAGSAKGGDENRPWFSKAESRKQCILLLPPAPTKDYTFPGLANWILNSK